MMGIKLARCMFAALILAGCQNRAAEPAPPAPRVNAEQAHVHDHHAHVAEAAAPALTGQSVYHFKAKLTDQDGKAFELASLRGSAVLSTMFYASCTSVCPMLIAQLKHIDETIPENARSQTQVVLVSLDPERDTPAKLKDLAQQHGIADARWHFLRADANDVRELAALLGIRYRQLPSGDILHSPLIALLDREGVITARLENAADNPEPLLSALTIQSTIHGP